MFLAHPGILRGLGPHRTSDVSDSHRARVPLCPVPCLEALCEESRAVEERGDDKDQMQVLRHAEPGLGYQMRFLRRHSMSREEATPLLGNGS